VRAVRKDPTVMTTAEIRALAAELAPLIAVPACPPLVDARRAAELLDVPASWLLAEARANRVPHVRLGRYVRFDPADLRAWAGQHAAGPRARVA